MIQDFNFSQKKDNEEGMFSVGDIVFCWNKGRVRQANEDDWGAAITPNGYLFTVCDGMGGHIGGQEASRIAVETILKFLDQKYDAPIDNVLENAILEANRTIFQTALDNPALKGMGTTACVLLLQDNMVYFAHVGDSRIYLFRKKDKTLYRITKDHSLVQTLVDRWEAGDTVNGIPDSEAETYPQKNIIMKALGIKKETQPTIRSGKPANGDIFLICSDGLSGMINDAAIESVLKDPDTTLAEKGEELIKLANAPDKGKDNITLQLIHISNSPNKITSKFPNYNPQVYKIIFGHKITESKKKWLSFLVIEIATALLLVFLLGGILYFIHINSENDKIEELRKNRDNAQRQYDDLESKVAEEKGKYCIIAQDTEYKKKQYDENKNNTDFEIAYEKQQKIDNDAIIVLNKLIKRRDDAKRKVDSLLFFPIDSASIVNPSKE